MYKTENNIEAPDHNAKVWRYLDMAKFIRVLQTRALFFPTAQRFTDRFEGTLTRPSLSECVNVFMKASGISEEQARQSIVSAPGMVGINCWHLSEYESAAMWAVYAPKGQGIAIQSTFERLLSAPVQKCA